MRPAIQFIHNKFGNKPLIGVEVGVEKGFHAGEILDSLNLMKLYLVDVWGIYIQEEKRYDSAGRYEFALQRFKGKENVVIRKQDSVEASKQFEDESLDFVYIDANHQYESVKRDIEAWFPKIKEGGILSGHDYCTPWDGVIKAVDEFVKKTNCILRKEKMDWWIEK